jgi:type II restriction enzyme
LTEYDLSRAKNALDMLIKKQRVALYKPIQIAVILYQARKGELSIEDIRYRIETFRNPSKRWRDVVTTLLINQVSTSSQKYQDNLFESNAMPQGIIAILAEHNNEYNGVVEKYIYQQFRKKQGIIMDLISMISEKTPETFRLEDFLSLFIKEKGIKRSIDKSYEAVV